MPVCQLSTSLIRHISLPGCGRILRKMGCVWCHRTKLGVAMRWSGRFIGGMAMAIAIVCSVGLAAAPAATAGRSASAPSGGCADVLFVGAAGSGESGLGPTVKSVYNQLRSRISRYRTIQMQAIPYPADSVSASPRRVSGSPRVLRRTRARRKRDDQLPDQQCASVSSSADCSCRVLPGCDGYAPGCCIGVAATAADAGNPRSRLVDADTRWRR